MPAMLKLILMLLLCSVCCCANAASVATTTLSPSAISNLPPSASHKPHFIIATLEQLAGRKLTFREKLAVKIAGFRRRPRHRGEEPTELELRQGKIAMIFGILSLPALFIPGGIFIAIPFAIVAMILGTKSIQGNSNFPGLFGMILGTSVLSILILGLIIFALFFRFK